MLSAAVRQPSKGAEQSVTLSKKGDYGQSELKMEAAGTAVTLHFSVHLTAAGKSSQLELDCSQ
jgi:hypothetical protein